ncbi:MAG: chorismate transformation enzyme, FkbO/Hyg5 family [Acidiferrobacterales bacterium]
MSNVMTEEIAVASPRLVCASPAQLEAVLAKFTGRILGVLAYAATRPEWPAGEVPCTWVTLPVLTGEAWYEVWVSTRAVAVSRDSGLSFSHDGGLLFGSLVLGDADAGQIDRKAFAAYSAIFDVLDRMGYPELLRVWNYFPDINGADRGMERYREFNVGRYEAFCRKGRAIGDGMVPAACALGTRQGTLVVCFLAGRAPGIYIENPRQTNAYLYPSDFGPRSPTFSRGVLVGDALLVSGTASIVGSKTMHPGDVLRQLDETLENLRVVVAQARARGFATSDPAGLSLNVYLRHATDYPVVRGRLDAEFGGARIAFLQADVCRTDLLVEIEAFWMPIP